MEIVRLASLDDPRIGLFTNLTERQLRNKLEPEKGIFIAESLKVIRLALRCGVAPIALLMEEKWLERLADVLPALPPSTPVYVLQSEQIEQITGYNVTRGALMACTRPPERRIDDVLEGAHKVIVLEDITDASNVGAAFRSAAALGADAVLLTHATVDPLVRRTMRVSMGTVLQVPWARIPTSGKKDSGAAYLREKGFATLALALSDDALPLDDPRLKEPDRVALFLGTEGDGLASSTIEGCDYTVTIPMFHGVDSLNVAAASAVACWDLFK